MAKKENITSKKGEKWEARMLGEYHKTHKESGRPKQKQRTGPKNMLSANLQSFRKAISGFHKTKYILPL